MGKPIKKSDQDKSWNKRQNQIRVEKNIAIQNSFLIYCEGENTEPEYFKSFNINKETTKVRAIGLGRSRTALIEKIIELVEKENDSDQQIWAVFDRDVSYTSLEQGNADFNNAIKLAEENNIKCAYSNDCFELWFVLHREYPQAAHHRKHYYEKLSDWLGSDYETLGKGKDFAKSLYHIFDHQVEIAIETAEKLHNSHTGKEFHQQNPCTTVYKLVEELRKNLRK
jgi:RloB-like protein